MIKPEDIPIDFAEIAEELFKEGYWSHHTRIHAAAILNAAIEAGLVSPPCYQPVVDGKPLEDTFGPTVFTTQQGVEEWFLGREMCRESWGARHWKGQTE